MSNTFVPLKTMPEADTETASFQLRVLPQAETHAAFEALPEPGKPEPAAAKACARPTITLQKQGEVVSGIRIECGCGQVIELACGY